MSKFFPPVEEADSDGLVGVGGELSTEWLLDAYQHGIFPWPLHKRLLAWWSPDPRAIFELDALRVSHRLRRTLRSGKFTVRADQQFAAVMRGCATAQGRKGATWITREICDGYLELHHQGHAHSIEVYHDGQLAGGTYGVSFGGLFAAESMFYQVRDASKVALFHLLRHLNQRGYSLLDIQQLNPHTQRMGAIEIPRPEFLRRLSLALPQPVTFAPWQTTVD